MGQRVLIPTGGLIFLSLPRAEVRGNSFLTRLWLVARRILGASVAGAFIQAACGVLESESVGSVGVLKVW